MIPAGIFSKSNTTDETAKPLTLMAFLTRLISVCLAPLVLLAVYLAISHIQSRQGQRDREAEHQVRNVATAVDRQIQAQISALQMLAASPLVDDPPRLHEFYKEAGAFREAFGGHVILADTTLQMLLNTRRPLGESLPKLPKPRGNAAAPVALESGKPAVGDMFFGPIAKAPLVAVAVPVIRNGRTKYLLLSVIEARRFRQNLDQASIPADWSLTLLDGKKEVIARRSPPDNKSFPGDGESSGRFAQKSAVSHWSVVLDVPLSDRRESIIAAGSGLAAAILAATLVSVLGGVTASRRLAASVKELAETPSHRISRPVIAEIEAVRRKMIDASAARDEAEMQLMESERRYRDLYEYAPDMYVSVDAATGRIVQCNQTVVRVMGYAREEIIGCQALDLYHPDSRDEARKVFQLFQTTGEVHNADLKLIRKNGSDFDAILNASAVYDENGKIAYSRSTLRDISDLKKAERELQASKGKLEAALAGMTDAVFISDAEGNFIEFNEAFATFHKFRNKEECSKTLADYSAFLDVFTADGEPAPLEQWAVPRALRGETVTNAERLLRRKDTGESWVGSYSFAPIRDRDGVIVGSVVVGRDITDRKQAEEALKQSEERLRLALDAAKAGVWEWDLETNENFWSQELWALYGLDPHTCRPSYETWRGTIHPDDRAEAERTVREAASNGLDLNAEWRMNDGGEEQRRVLSRGRPIRDASGRPLRYIGIVLDITDRKRVEAALKESEKKFRLLYEEAPIPYQSLDEDGSLLQVNAAWLELLGYSRTEVIGKSFADFLSSASKVRFKETFSAFKNTGRMYGVEHEMIRKDGTVIDVSIDGRISRSADGRFGHTHCVFQDVTQKKKAERALQESEQRYRAVIDNLHLGISVLDSGMKITAVNRFFKEVYPEVEPGTGQFCYQMYNDPPKTAPCDNCPCVKTFQDGMAHECVRENPAGNKVHNYRVVACPIKDAEGRVEFVIELAEDITETRSLQLQLAQAQKMEAVGTLAGGVAHDFNNILQVALGYSELMLDDEEFPNEYRSDLERISESAKQGADLVKRLLMFSRKTEINPQPLNLNHRVIELRKMLGRTLPKMIDVRLSLGESIAMINADPTQIDQVLMNLAVNARDAMPDGGELIFATSDILLDEEYARTHLDAEPGAHVLLMVTDTGSGIDRDAMEHIFEPFYTTKSVGEGTGLGLAMVHGIVKQHGGHIRCYSEPGEGTTFRVYFPALISDEEKATTEERVMPQGGSETILLVDDEEFIRDAASRTLIKVGYKVITACNGKEALRVYEAGRSEIDLVLLDLMMPEMGGKECLEGLLNLNPSVKVVIASGYPAEGPTKNALGTGAKGFVNKPYDVRRMLEVVRGVLDGSGV